jgi:hypothetical protein
MNDEQLEKRLQWLDDERRVDKTLLSSLENRLLELEGKLGVHSESIARKRSRTRRNFTKAGSLMPRSC